MFIILTKTVFFSKSVNLLKSAKFSGNHDSHSANSSSDSSSGILGLSSSDTSRSTSLLTGRSNTGPVADWTVIDLTWPSSCRRAARTLAMGHLFLEVFLSFNRTISPSAMFLLWRVHLCLAGKLCKYSLLHLFQNSLAICCTRFQRRLQ